MLFLFFACNSGKKDAEVQQLRDSLRMQQKQIDSLQSITLDTHRKKAIRDSLRKIKLTYWKKQSTLMSTSLSADKATLNHAKQQLEQDKKRSRQINDSLRKYRE